MAGELALAVWPLTNDLLGVQPARAQTRGLIWGLDVAPLPLKAGSGQSTAALLGHSRCLNQSCSSFTACLPAGTSVPF